MGALMQDIRYGIRVLGKNPGFTLIAVLTLALGIGANTAIFSVVDAVLIRSLPFQNPSRIVWAWGNFSLYDKAAVSPPDFLVYRAQNHVLEHWGAIGYGTDLFNLAGNDKPQQVRGSMITQGFFETLGVRPLLGRTFSLSDEQEHDPRVVILSNRFWRERFASDPGVIGQSLKLDASQMTVVGVLAADLPLFSDAEVWIPAPFQNEGMSSHRTHFFRPIGLLKPGVTIPQAQADLDTIAARLAAEFPDTNKGWNLRLEPAQRALVGDVRPVLFVLLGAVGLVLLIACANVASLLLARNSARGREIAIRTALGAGRFRLVRQMLTESVLLALAGGAAGILLASWGAGLVRKFGPESLPRLNEVSVNGPVLLFTAAVALVTGILFGLVPAMQASRRDLTLSLKEGGSSGDSRKKHRAHNALVVAEVALSLVVLIASGLLLNSFWRLIHVRPGFDASNVLTTQVALIMPTYKAEPAQAAFFRNLQDRLKSIPGVESAGFISELPMSGQVNDTFFTIAEHPPADPNDREDADFRVVGGDYFSAMRIPLISGSEFSPANAAGSPQVILINEPFARRFFGAENPIGKHLSIFEGKPEFVSREIIGVVGGNKHFALQESPRPEMFIPLAQAPRSRMNVVVRSAGDPAALASAVREAVQSVDSDEATSAFRTMNDVVSESASGDRFNAVLLGAFGAIALLLTAAGIFGVLSYLVTQRTREIGLRVALGAQPRDVLGVIVGHGMRLALAGLAIGLAGAFAVTHWMSSFLYGVKPTDPLTFAAVTVLLSATAFAACYFPARRAMRVDPMVALRYE
ncbi:MAG: ABC transporter permease [Candidatus Acidiferrales bacterium]